MFRFGDPGGAMYGAPTTTSASNAANLLQAWTAQTGSSGAQGDSQIYVSAGSGRLSGTPALVFNSKDPNRWSWLQKTLPDNQTTLGIAFAINLPILPTQTPQLVRFLDSSTVQLDLRVNPSGQLVVSKGSGTQLGTQGGTISPNVWTHIEMLATFNSSGGSAFVYVNGAQVYSFSGNTISSANNYAQSVTLGVGTSDASANCGLGTSGSNRFTYFDDIIIYDGQTTDANGYPDIHAQIGNMYLFWLLPTAAGQATNWTPLAGSNWSSTADTTVDDDTSYVSSSTLTQNDTYTMADLPATVVAVKSVMAVNCAKVDAGSRSIKSELYSGGGATDHATSQVLTSSYAYYMSNWGQNPNNGSAINWTVAAVNALNAGQIVSA